MAMHELLFPSYCNIVSIQDHQKIQQPRNPCEGVAVFKSDILDVPFPKIKSFCEFVEQGGGRMILLVTGDRSPDKIRHTNSHLRDHSEECEGLMPFIVPDLCSKP